MQRIPIGVIDTRMQIQDWRILIHITIIIIASYHKPSIYLFAIYLIYVITVDSKNFITTTIKNTSNIVYIIL